MVVSLRMQQMVKKVYHAKRIDKFFYVLFIFRFYLFNLEPLI
jgi:hypothetical protein